jgi:hypothetical protein
VVTLFRVLNLLATIAALQHILLTVILWNFLNQFHNVTVAARGTPFEANLSNLFELLQITEMGSPLILIRPIMSGKDKILINKVLMPGNIGL